MSSNPNSLPIQYCLSTERALKIILQNLRQCRLARAAIEGKANKLFIEKNKTAENLLVEVSLILKNKNSESINDFYACRFYHSLLLNELSNGRNLAEDLLVAYVRNWWVKFYFVHAKLLKFQAKSQVWSQNVKLSG